MSLKVSSHQGLCRPPNARFRKKEAEQLLMVEQGTAVISRLLLSLSCRGRCAGGRTSSLLFTLT